MNCKEIKEATKEMARENAGVLLLSYALSAVVAVIPLLGWVALPPVLLGHYENCYSALKGKETSWKKLYGKFDKQFESSFQFILYCEVAAGVVLIIGACALGLLSALIPFLLVITIPAAIVADVVVGFVLAGLQNVGLELLLLNPEMKGSEAFDKARELIKQNWKLFVSLGVSFIGQMLLIAITFGLYLVKALPHITMAFTMLTDEIINGNISANSGKEEKAGPVVFCSECGAKNSAEAIYCEKCGSKLIK